MASPVTYNQSVGPEGAQHLNPIVQGPQDHTGAAIAQLGGALDNASGAVLRYEDRRQVIEDQNAMAEAHVTVAKASADAYQQFADWQDAQGDNPQGFTPKVMKSYDQFTGQIIANTPNVKAQQFMRASFANLGMHMQDRAINWEAQQNVEYKGTQLFTAGKDYARVLGNDPSAYVPIQAGMYQAVEDSGLPLKARTQLHEQIDDMLVKAAWTGFAIRDPKGAQAASNEALQVPPPATVTAGPVTKVEQETALMPEGTRKPVIHNADGSISTERTITVEQDGKHYVIPSIVDGKQRTPAEATDLWTQGKNQAVGVYDTADQAEVAATKRSELIAWINEKPRPYSAPKVSAATQGYASDVSAAGKKWNVDSNILLAQIQQESTGNAAAVGPETYTGDRSIGLAQFQPATAKQYGIDPKDPKQSIEGQAHYMADLLKQFGGDYEKALAAYNWGPGHLVKGIAAAEAAGQDWHKVLPDQTKNYLTRILGNVGAASQPAPPPKTPTEMAAAATDSMVAVTPSMPADPNATVTPPKGAPAWAAKMNTADWIAMKTHADAAVAHQQGIEQARLRVAMTDAGKAAELGMTPVIPSLAEFQSAYGNTVGQFHFNSAVRIRDVGQLIASVKTMTPEQMIATQKAAYAKLSAPGLQPGELTELVHTAGLVDSAITTVAKARENDPIWAAGQQGLAKINQIDWSKADAALTELKSRQGVAIDMRKTHGVGDYSALTKGEAAALRQQYDASPWSTKQVMLTQLRTALTNDDVYRATIQAIRPDSPVTGALGSLVVKTSQMKQGEGIWWGQTGVTITPQQASETMSRGEDILNPTRQAKTEDGKPGRPATLPKESDLRTAWQDAVGNAFRGNSKGENAGYQLYRAYYAGKASELGILGGEIDGKIAKQAAEVATGGLYKWNGGKGGDSNTVSDSGMVVKPWGMDDARFKDEINAAYTAAAAAAGRKLPPLDNLGLVPKQTGDKDVYLLTAAGHPVFDARGKLIELDITPRPQQVKVPQ